MTTQLDESRVLFEMYRPNAKYASVAGEFNRWDPQAAPMRRNQSGYWECTLELPPGAYPFRYYIDGYWVVDCASFGLQPGPFGWNSVVYVRPPLAA